MAGYKYSAKPRLRSPKVRAYASKLESEVAVNFAMLVAPDSPMDEASKICFQTTTVPISVFESHVWESGKRKGVGVAVKEAKTLRNFDNVRSSIDDWRSTIGDIYRLRRTSTTWETDLEAHRSLERKVLTEARVLTAISRGKQPN